MAERSAAPVASGCGQAGWRVAGRLTSFRRNVRVEGLQSQEGPGECGPKLFTLAIDWPELMRFKRTFTDPVPELTEQGWAGRGRSVPRPRTLRRARDAGREG
jgi:hypothetical protein